MSVYGQYVLEFSISDSLKTLKDKLIKAINNLLDKVNNKLKEGKDNKVKSILRHIIDKLKSLLNKTNKAKDIEECKNIKIEVDECKVKFKELIDTLEDIKKSKDSNYRLQKSNELAKDAGVSESELLRTLQDIDNYFLK